MRQWPKPVRYRNPSYLAWIRDMPCWGCGLPGPSDPHHVSMGDGSGGWGTKRSDLLTLPLCRSCHDRSYVEANREDAYREIAKLLERWIREREK